MINYNYSILYSSQFMSVSCLPIKLVCEYNKYIDSIYILSYHICECSGSSGTSEKLVYFMFYYYRYIICE